MSGPGGLPDDFKAGDVLSASSLDRIKAWLESCRLRVQAPLMLQRTPDGQVLGRDRSGEPYLAKLDGAVGSGSNPYTSRQGYRLPDGSFHVFPGAPAIPAFEVNGQTGLGGTVQRVRAGTDKDVRFQEVRYGPGTPPTCSYNVTVYGCGKPAVGASVTLGSYGTRTTDSTGSVTFTGVSPGTVSLSVNATPGFLAYSASVTVACPNVGTSVTLTPDASNPCMTNCGSLTSCPFPPTVTIQVTDACAWGPGSPGDCFSDGGDVGTYSGIDGPTTVVANYLSHTTTQVRYTASFGVTVHFVPPNVGFSRVIPMNLTIDFFCFGPTSIHCLWTVRGPVFPNCTTNSQSGVGPYVSTCEAFFWSGGILVSGVDTCSPSGVTPTWTIS